MKRIVTVQDISCVGKCSLTVALPIISAMGVECSVLPTAVLSTHTMFPNFTFRDLTDDIAPIAAHWKAEKFSFDAIYTGYLGSFRQLQLVSELIDEFRTPESVVFIDPVMADNGELYPGFTPEFARAMAGFCGKADVIVPNLTEAAFLLDRPYQGEGYSETDIRELLKHLAGLGAKNVVLTGVKFSPKEFGVMGYQAEKEEFFSYFHHYVPASFHGTGDIFSSTVVGALMRGLPLEKALMLAADYTVECISGTRDAADTRYGVKFEQAIPKLLERLNG